MGLNHISEISQLCTLLCSRTCPWKLGADYEAPVTVGLFLFYVGFSLSVMSENWDDKWSISVQVTYSAFWNNWCMMKFDGLIKIKVITFSLTDKYPFIKNTLLRLLIYLYYSGYILYLSIQAC